MNRIPMRLYKPMRALGTPAPALVGGKGDESIYGGLLVIADDQASVNWTFLLNREKVRFFIISVRKVLI